MEVPEDFERKRHGRGGTDQDESPADRLALLVGQYTRQQKAETGSQGRSGADEQGKFRQGHLDYSHRADPFGLSRHNRQDGSIDVLITFGEDSARRPSGVF
jgi:hypothetical protein